MLPGTLLHSGDVIHWLRANLAYEMADDLARAMEHLDPEDAPDSLRSGTGWPRAPGRVYEFVSSGLGAVGLACEGSAARLLAWICLPLW